MTTFLPSVKPVSLKPWRSQDSGPAPPLPRGRRRAAEKADDRDDPSARLRARHGGPGDRSGAQQQKIAPSHAPPHLKAPRDLKYRLASGWSPVYPCHVPAREMRQHPIGTGPFKFVDFKPNEAL